MCTISFYMQFKPSPHSRSPGKSGLFFVIFVAADFHIILSHFSHQFRQVLLFCLRDRFQLQMEDSHDFTGHLHHMCSFKGIFQYIVCVGEKIATHYHVVGTRMGIHQYFWLYPDLWQMDPWLTWIRELYDPQVFPWVYLLRLTGNPEL